MKAIFKSVWDGESLGYDSSCRVEISSGEVLDVEMFGDEATGECLDRQEVRMRKLNGEIVTLEIDEQQWENSGTLFIKNWERYRKEKFMGLE